MRLTVLIIPLAFLSGLARLEAAPTLTHLYPSGGQRGTEFGVTAKGTFSNWPVSVWVSVPGVSFEATKKKGELQARIAKDARLGWCWARLYDRTGASPLRPFYVGDLPHATEKEPNDARATATRVENPVIAHGVLEKRGEVDGFQVRLEEKATLVASLTANRWLASPMDGTLQVVSDRGIVLAENDDWHGVDPRIVFVAPRAGDYIVRTFAFPTQPNSTIGFAGDKSYVYQLTLTTGAYVDHPMPLAAKHDGSGRVALRGWNLPADFQPLSVPAGPERDDVVIRHPALANTTAVRLVSHASILEVEPNSLAHAQQISPPVTISGYIQPRGDVDAFRFAAKKGEQLVITVDARALGSPLDPRLRIVDTQGKALASADDQGRNLDARLAYKVAADGEYRLEVHDVFRSGSRDHFYRLRVERPVRDFRLRVKTDLHTKKKGKPLDVTVTVERDGGFDGEVVVAAEGLPEGLAAAPVTSAPKGDSAKKVTLRITESGTANSVAGAFRIVGRGKAKGTASRFATAPRAGAAPGPDLWLTVTP